MLLVAAVAPSFTVQSVSATAVGALFAPKMVHLVEARRSGAGRDLLLTA